MNLILFAAGREKSKVTTGDVSRRAREDAEPDPELLTCVFPTCDWSRPLTGPTEQDAPTSVHGRFSQVSSEPGAFRRHVAAAALAMAEAMAADTAAAYEQRMIAELREHLEAQHPEYRALITEHLPGIEP